MPARIDPFLMFEGKAEEALSFYVSLFPESAVLDIRRYGPDGPGAPGSIMSAVYSLAGQRVMCTDSWIAHGFTFTPSFSFFVTCDDQADLARLAAALSDGGKVLMPQGNYGFSTQFAWVTDRYGVSWQINLP